MRKSAAVTIRAAVGLSLLAASLPASLTACVGLPNDLGADRQTIGVQTDQLTAPKAKTGAEAAAPAASEPNAGSFPRSFLIPGTNTSVSISGSVDSTIGYSGR